MRDASSLDTLLDTAYRQTLARFEKEADSAERDPREEIAVYRRRRRDYLSLLRLDRTPDEARDLAARLLETRALNPDARQREAFEKDVARMLVRLYEAFIRNAEQRSSQGSR